MMLLLVALAGPALLAPPVLQAMVEDFAGLPAAVDPRLLLPACPAPAIGWATPASVEVRCPAPAWRIFVTVGARQPASDTGRPAALASAVVAAPAPPAIRRGDRVMLEFAGEGFVVAVETTAAADARDGRVPLRTATGRTLSGRIGSDGRVRTTGLSPAGGGR